MRRRPSRPLRIVQVIGTFRPLVGGAERQCELQARELARRGHDVIVLTGRWSRHGAPPIDSLPPLGADSTPIIGSDMDSDTGSGSARCYGPPRPVRIRRLPMWYGGMGIPGLGRFGRWRFMTALASALWRLREWADVIQVHQLAAAAIVAGFARRRLGIPTAAKIACSGEFSDLRYLQHGINGVEERWLWPMTLALDRVVALNPEVSAELTAAGFAPSHIRVIPNGVEIPPIPAERAEFRRRVAFVSRLTAQKNLPVVIDALALLKLRGQQVHDGDRPWHVTIFGDGPERETLRERAISAKVADCVTFAGAVAGVSEKLREWADLFVLPSRSEGMSNALLEALALGIPAVVSDIPAHSAIFAAHPAGWKFPVESPSALADALLHVAAHPEKWRTAAVAARELARSRYSLEAVVDAYETLYVEMLAEHHAQHRSHESHRESREKRESESLRRYK